MSSSDSRRQEATEQMWYAAEDCLESVQSWLEMLGRCRLRLGYRDDTAELRCLRNSDSGGWWSSLIETNVLPLSQTANQRGAIQIPLIDWLIDQCCIPYTVLVTKRKVAQTSQPPRTSTLVLQDDYIYLIELTMLTHHRQLFWGTETVIATEKWLQMKLIFNNNFNWNWSWKPKRKSERG